MGTSFQYHQLQEREQRSYREHPGAEEVNRQNGFNGKTL